MPTGPNPSTDPDHRGTDPDRRRVVVAGDGPILIEGPVEIELDDGTRVRSDRFVTAICTCRRSRRYPICDTSHRPKVRADRG